MNKLTKVKLSDVADIIGGGTPDTKKQEFWNGNIPWITPKDLSSYNYRYISNGERNITKKGLENSSARILPQGSILLTSRAPIGYIAIAQNELCTNQGFKSLILKENNCPLFFYYLLKNNIKYIINMSSGSTFPEISGSQVKNLEFNIPDLTTQEKIARVLSSLDDKIELNNKINQNLEQQAQAIFKSWFVDFEPFDGKMPDDWKIGTISELGTVVGGSTPSKKNPEYYTNNGIAWITPKDLSRKNLKFISKGEIDITDKGFKNSSVTIMPKGTVLFSSRAPIGYISIAQNDVTTNQGFKSVIPFQTVGTPYVYLYLKNNITLIENMAAGSTFKEVSGSIMQNIPALIPSKKILKRFNTLCDKIFRKQEYLEVENEKLTQLRDTLLPKLMSGEINVDKVEV